MLKGRDKVPFPFSIRRKMNKYLELVGYARPVYRKCELCKRVKDVSYRLDVKNAETSAMLTGSLDLCKHCAANWGEIIRKG